MADARQAARPVETAAGLAELLGSELVLVHVVSPPPAVYAGDVPTRVVLPEDRARLEQAAEVALADIAVGCGVGSATRKAAVGDPADAVVASADELDAELIVVGARRRGLFVSALLGSVSRSIADTSERPVVVVPSSEDLRPLVPVERILCGVDDSDESRRAAAVAARLAERLDATLVLATARPPSALPGVSAAAAGTARLDALERDEGVAFLERLVAELGLPAGTDVRSRPGRPAAVLQAVADEEDAALIVVGRRGGVVRDFVRGSVSAALQAQARRLVVLA